MTEHEKYQEHIRHTHDAFCKTVIRHAAIDAARSIRSRRKREISLEYLIEEKHYPFSTTDKYFAEQSGMTSYPLFVCGQMVLLESPELAAALSALSQMEQEIIFLYYFQRLTHREIGRRYGRAGNTTGRRIQMILRRLRFYFTSFFFLPASTTKAVSAANIASTKGIARILSAVFTPALSACASDAVSVPVTEPAVEDWTDSDGCPDVVGCETVGCSGVVGSVGVVGCSGSDGVVGCSFTT